jgi:hypothetical protein
MSVGQDAGTTRWQMDLAAASGRSRVFANGGVVQIGSLLRGVRMLWVAVLDRFVRAHGVRLISDGLSPSKSSGCHTCIGPFLVAYMPSPWLQ